MKVERVRAMTNNFAYNVRFLRKARRINQKELAAIVGKSVRTICAWERGTRLPLVEDVYVLAQYFGTDMETLYFGEVNAGI